MLPCVDGRVGPDGLGATLAATRNRFGRNLPDPLFATRFFAGFGAPLPRRLFLRLHAGAPAQRGLEVGRAAVLRQQVAERLVGDLLEVLHPVMGQKVECVPGLVVELDALAGHDDTPNRRRPTDARKPPAARPVPTGGTQAYLALGSRRTRSGVRIRHAVAGAIADEVRAAALVLLAGGRDHGIDLLLAIDDGGAVGRRSRGLQGGNQQDSGAGGQGDNDALHGGASSGPKNSPTTPTPMA